MKRKLLLLSISLVLLLAAGQTRAQQQIGPPKQGLALANQLCSQCHAVEKGEASSAASAPRFEDIANTPGMTAMALNVFFQTPHRAMPNVILTADQKSALIAYILSLKK
jgi:mono/diheme cytochrome c family protein